MSYVVKVTLPNGDLRPPFVANFPDEQSAIAAVKPLVDAMDHIEVKGIGEGVMAAAFGVMPGGTVVSRPDWEWAGEGKNTPRQNKDISPKIGEG